MSPLSRHDGENIPALFYYVKPRSNSSHIGSQLVSGSCLHHGKRVGSRSRPQYLWLKLAQVRYLRQPAQWCRVSHILSYSAEPYLPKPESFRIDMGNGLE